MNSHYDQPEGETAMLTQIETRLPSAQPVPARGNPTPDPGAVRAGMKATWEDGDYAAFAT
ncbi:MAG: hypothetical protein ABFS24_05685 [Pseudomonadota bacterium]